MHQLPESGQQWACVLEDAEIYKTGFASREAALGALQGQAGEVVRYERGFALDVAAELFGDHDVEALLQRAEVLGLAGGAVLGHVEDGLFGSASVSDLEDLRLGLSAAFVSWVEKKNLPIWRVVEREEVELVTDAKDCTA